MSRLVRQDAGKDAARQLHSDKLPLHSHQEILWGKKPIPENVMSTVTQAGNSFKV